MKTITYIKGDCTKPIGDGIKIIPHVCNTIGAWGAGFVLALSAKWKEPEQQYRSLKDRDLGIVQFIKVEDNIIVANMIAQEGIGFSKTSEPPIRYGAVRIGLSKVNELALKLNATIHMPRIGCGLAGGKWDEIEKIIKDTIVVDTYVYDFK